MLNVMFVYFEPQISGLTTHVLSLANRLDKSKYAITVVVPAHLHHCTTAFKQSGVAIVPLTMRKVFWNIKSTISMMMLIRREKIDIVHVHGQEAGILVRVLARLARAQVIIYTPQCTNIRNVRWFWLYRSLEKVLSFITDMIISVNEIDRTKLIQWGIHSSKVITIKNGIDPNSFNEPINVGKVKHDHGLDENLPLVMQVGRLSDQKNPLAFVEGASIVVREHPDVIFVLVGDGPLKEKVVDYIQDLGMGNQVHCLGWQDNANKLIAIADIITLTSRWEGLPYVLLEAMAWSRPVVTTAVNGCPEIVKHGITGYLVPENDTDSWARYVIKLLENPGQSVEMGQRGIELLKNELSLQNMVEQTEKLYDSLIN